MATQLRPLRLGEILDRTAELYRNHFLLFAGIAALFSGVMLLVQLLNLAVLHQVGYPNLAPHLLWVTGVSTVLFALAVMLLAGLAIAANNRAVAWVYLDQPATIRGAMQSVLPRLRRYLWLMTITFFRAWSPLAVLYIAFFALAFSILPPGFLTNPGAAQTAAPIDPTTALNTLVGFVILAPLFLAALVYGIWMSLRYALAMPACVVEDLTAGAALKRSIQLSKGGRGRIFVLALLIYCIRMVIALILSLPYVVFVFKHIGQNPPLGWLAVQQLAGFVTNALIGPIYATGLTLFYYDQRVRKEGFDIEWMMQAAGLSVPAQTPALQAAQDSDQSAPVVQVIDENAGQR
jgi:hypothetical protein